MEATVSWNTHLSFTGRTRGHETELDTVFKNGGLNRGPTPKEILLESMCACSGMDVIAILDKSKHLPLTFEMSAHAEQTKTTPAYFAFVKIIYKAMGDTPANELIKAVDLSMTKYCGVSYMISKVCPITYDIFLNDQKVGSGEAKFNI